MRVIAIDPGNMESAMVIMDAETFRPLEMCKKPNKELQTILKCMLLEKDDRAVIERVQNLGMVVGREVFETAEWWGIFYETLQRRMLRPPGYVYRKEEKLHICDNFRAKDANIRRALIDRFAKHDLHNGKGTKKNPDWFYGFGADMWAAYAVGLTYIETKLRKEI